MIEDPIVKHVNKNLLCCYSDDVEDLDNVQ